MLKAGGIALSIIAFAAPFLVSAASCPALARGATGPAVSAVQRILFEAYAGFPSPTGYFGPTTEAAVKQWQGEHSIEALGIVGPKTAVAMKVDLCVGSSTSTGSSSSTSKNSNQSLIDLLIAQVKVLQAKLAALLAGSSTSNSTSTISTIGGDGGGGTIITSNPAPAPNPTPNPNPGPNPIPAPHPIPDPGPAPSPAPTSNYDADGYLKVDAHAIFASAQSMLPPGSTYADTIPDTIDLADMLGQFIKGATATAQPGWWYMPTGALFIGPVTGETSFGTAFCPKYGGYPCLIPDPNDWGLWMNALADAREVSGFDRSDAMGTVSTQYAMFTNMLSKATLQGAASAGFTNATDLLKVPVYSSGAAPSEASQVMEALVSYAREFPGNTALQAAVSSFAQMHADKLASGHYYIDDTLGCYEIGCIDGYSAFIHGLAAHALLEAATAGTNAALATGRSVLSFMQSHIGAGGTPLLPNGSFNNHIYSIEQGVLAELEDAKIRTASNPNDSTAASEITNAKAIYAYIKQDTLAGFLGDFGVTGATSDMIRIALRLGELGAGATYYDDAEYWTRNQLREEQIDAGAIASASGKIPTSTSGLFFSDATHAFSIPLNAKNMRYDDDAASQAAVAIHDVAQHVSRLSGSDLSIDMLMNGAGPYATVHSDLPYRGQVQVETAQSLGPISRVAIRIPGWADQSAVTVTALGQDGVQKNLAKGSDWSLFNSYAYIPAAPNTAYTIHFPMKIQTVTSYTLRDPGIFWYEGSVAGNGGAESRTAYATTFRGYDLVSFSPSITYAGIPRYVEEWRANLASRGAADITPPAKSISRFVYQGSASSIPIALTIKTPAPAPAPTPVPDTLNNGNPYQGQVPLAVTLSGSINGDFSCAGATYTLSYNDGAADQIAVPAGTCAPTSFSKAHTFTSGGFYDVVLLKGSLSDYAAGNATVVAHTPINVSAPTPPSLTLTINGQTGTVHVGAGGAYTIAWGSSNVTSCAASTYAVNGGVPQQWSVNANGSWSFLTNLAANSVQYTEACTGSDGSTASVTITAVP